VYAYSIESLLTDLTQKMDDAVWNLVRAFDEGELFMRQLNAMLKADLH